MSNEVRIFISGDFAPMNRVLDVIQSGNYNLLYNELLPIIKSADIVITNLETPLLEEGTPIQKTGPNLKAPVKSIEALKFAGFNLLSLANNHIMDYGWAGLKSTMEICRNHNIDFIGAGEDLKEAEKPKFIKHNDETIAIINVAENEWSTTQGNEAGANPLNSIYQYYQIIEAKKNADYLLLIVHGGHETYGLPSPRMKKLYRFFIDIGVDAVIGHHTHCISGHEVYNNKPIIYSLGNFIFDNPKYRDNSDWNKGCAVMLKIKDKNIYFELIPFYQCNEKVGISLLGDLERKKFMDNSNKKTEIIQDDRELEKHYKAFLEKQKKMYLSFLEPLKNKYLLALMNRGLLPRLIGRAQKRLLLNLIRTEAHKDVLIGLLTKEKSTK